MIQELGRYNQRKPMENFEASSRVQAEFEEAGVKGSSKRDKKRDSKKIVGVAERLLRKEENARLIREENEAASRTCERRQTLGLFLGIGCVNNFLLIWNYFGALRCLLKVLRKLHTHPSSAQRSEQSHQTTILRFLIS